MNCKNRVTLIGNISTGLVKKTAVTGKPVYLFSVATNYKELADFHAVSVWNEATQSYLDKIESTGGIKGMRVEIEGPLTYKKEEVTLADGSKRTMKTAYVRCHSLINFSAKKKEDAAPECSLVDLVPDVPAEFVPVEAV